MSFILLRWIILALIVNLALAFENIDAILDKVLQDNLDTYGIQPIEDRVKRAEKSRIVMKKQKAELPICQNMKGILGGQNAFNYVTLILSILTLVVNVNNNINNNNNNLNQFSGNVVGNNNANANTNNNNGNIVNVMPPGKKRRKRALNTSEYQNVTKCHQNSVLSDASLASLKLIQGLVKHEMTGNETCKDAILCETLQSVNKLGRIGQLFTKALKIGIGKYQSTREMSYAENVQKCQKQSSNCRNHQHQDIRCSKCGHKLVPRNATFLNDLITPHAHSVRSLDLFGQKNVTVQEFVNPHNFHFHSIQVSHAQIINKQDQWTGGDTWFPGYKWKVGYCPVCGEPIGWLWSSTSSSRNGFSSKFFGLRLDKILDWSNWIFGPSIRIPGLIVG